MKVREPFLADDKEAGVSGFESGGSDTTVVGEGIRSIYRKMMVPLVVVGVAVSLACMVSTYRGTREAQEESAKHQAKMLSILLSSGAEALAQVNQIQHLVTATGMEEHVALIVVAGGEPLRVLASTKQEWKGMSLDRVPDAQVVEDLQNTIALQKVEEVRRKDGFLRETASFHLNKSIVDAGRSGEGAVLVDVNTQFADRAAWKRAISLATVVAAGIGSLIVLSYYLVKQNVLRYVRAIEDSTRRNGLNAVLPLGASSLEEGLEQLARLVRQSLGDELAIQRGLLTQKFAIEPNVMVSVTDRDGYITYVNKRLEEVSGFSKAQLVGKTHRELSSGGHGASFFDEMWDQLKRGEVWYGRMSNHTFGGKAYWVDATYLPLRKEDGTVTGYVFFEVDVTVQKEAEEQLIASEQMFCTLAESVPALIWTTGMDGGCTYCNPAWLEFTGRKMELEEHTGWLQSIHPDDRERVWSLYGDTFWDNSRLTMTFRLLRVDGEYRTMDCTAVPNLDHAGRFSGYIACCTEAAVKVVKEKTEDKVEVKGKISEHQEDLLAAVNHEIRTPMNGVLGFAELLQDTSLTDKQHEYTDIIQSSGETLLKAVSDILDLSYMESGTLTLNRASFAPEGVICDVISEFQGKCTRKGVSLQMQMMEDVPKFLMGDEHRIRKVISHFVNRSVQTTHQGTIRIRCSTEHIFGLRFVRMEVVDSGTGLSDAQKAKLFAPIPRATAVSTRLATFSMSLSVCRRLVDLMGGQIGCEGEEGCGSVFWFTFPLEESTESPEDSETQMQRSLNGLRILVAEDNSVNQKFSIAALEKLGCEVDVAENGLAALPFMRKNKYDLVFMDCHMPEMDGYATTRAIRSWTREEGGNVPIIALTANALREDLDRCLEVGMNATLTKPVRIRELKSTIETWTSRRRAR